MERGRARDRERELKLCCGYAQIAFQKKFNMASDAESRKRKFSPSFSVEQMADTTLCPHCSRRFDDGDRLPRNLACGHTFCTACLGARIRQESARKWSIACPLDHEETSLKKNA